MGIVQRIHFHNMSKAPATAPMVAPGLSAEDPQVGLAVIEDAPLREEMKEAQIDPIPFGSKCATCLMFAVPPLAIMAACGGIYCVEQKSSKVTQHCGVLTEVQEEPGCYWSPVCGRHQQTCSVKQRTMDIDTAKVADGNGNPLIVSCIVNYRVIDPKKAILNVDDLKKYVNTNAQAVLKQTVSHFTYDQLKADYEHVNTQMRAQLQRAVGIAGVQVESINLNDLSYAPEVAAAMLKKQQAQALIEARTLIVQGAVRISQDAITLLEEDPNSGIKLNNEEKVKIVSNLLTVTCSEGEAVPTLGLQS